MNAPVVPERIVTRDDGVLARAVAPALAHLPAPDVARRLAWLVPAVFRAIEYTTLVVVGWLTGEAALAYGLLWVVATHHYETLYRLRERGSVPPTWLVLAAGGWEVRTLLVAGSAVVGLARPVLAVLLVWCGTLIVGEAVAAALRDRRAAR